MLSATIILFQCHCHLADLNHASLTFVIARSYNMYSGLSLLTFLRVQNWCKSFQMVKLVWCANFFQCKRQNVHSWDKCNISLCVLIYERVFEFWWRRNGWSSVTSLLTDAVKARRLTMWMRDVRSFCSGWIVCISCCDNFHALSSSMKPFWYLSQQTQLFIDTQRNLTFHSLF